MTTASETAGATVVRRPEFEWLARAGLVSRGVIYGVVGILAVKLALGSGGKATSQQGALQTIAHQPFGEALLIATTIGLAGYSIWRLMRAVLGHGRRDRDGAGERIAAGASGVAYAALCVSAIGILIGSGASGGGSRAAKHAAGGVLGWPAGTVIVAAVGGILIGVALYQGYKGLSHEFLDTSDTSRLSRGAERAFIALGVIGHLARMVVFGLIGAGLIEAAVNYDPRNAIGLDGALNQLAHAAYGPVLLGIVAAGLTAFALYSIVDARYRRV